MNNIVISDLLKTKPMAFVSEQPAAIDNTPQHTPTVVQSMAKFMHEVSPLVGGDLPLADNLDQLLRETTLVTTESHAVANLDKAMQRYQRSMQESQFDDQQVAEASRNVKHAVNYTVDEFSQKQRQLIKSLSQASKNSGTQLSNYPAHIANLETVVKDVKANFQDVYSEVVKQATEYFKDFNLAMSQLDKCIESGSDANKLKFEKREFARAIEKIMLKYSNIDALYTGDSSSDSGGKLVDDAFIDVKPIYEFKGSEEVLTFWQDKLSPTFNVKRDGGAIKILPNLETLKDVFESLKGSSEIIDLDGSDKHNILTATFQAWQAGFDSLKNRQQTAINQLMEKYRHDISTFDNLIQILIKSIDDHFRYNEGYFR
ncbi:IpaD/SipD/SspD family type III secretion system needle tip protein [Yersinia ruckeri]|uniref:IpaD/SipD/SspD family type III secretion system needle tip protein n=1 Tax=Yersinia ruckeri TaxID=29486 RepID=UPI0020BE07A4|nr:IpaD/SipD/SspD family type III secretion system needle tip protein [Yersinia ruckeri]EKN4182918.1 IpaD/SipD/SspD family type III secretion system needle tip protein [Yersinia ruckeri]MCK8555719.1 IpaD/SipD/SspD family type III secretion system needle tip protein [Yersinia ruckeri]